MKKIIKNKIFVILALILALGFFLRSYNFSEWLRFNTDQSRDMIIAQEAAEKNELPSYGPLAGGTDFKLGPFFYYFQTVSVNIFGSNPSSAAYPDLIFGLGSIILFFFLARIYFDAKNALALTFLYAISFFAIKYSRFAWNPNSTPFFAMLFIYSLYKISVLPENKKLFWAIMAGISVGIIIQLHTSLLIIFPILILMSFNLLLKGNWLKKSTIAIILFIAVVANTGQIIEEIKSKGLNTRQFFLGSIDKNGRNSNWGSNLLLNLSCHVKANSYILTARGEIENCDYKDEIQMFKKMDNKKIPIFEKIKFIFLIILSLAFSLGGYFLFFRSIRNESDKNVKLFLKLVGIYITLFFLFSIIWATELSIRFFLPLTFIPFILLGLWIAYLEKFVKIKWLPLVILIVLISFFNLRKILEIYRDLEQGGREIGGNFEYMTLGEGEFITDYIEKNSIAKKVFVDAQGGYLFKTKKSLEFLARQKGIEIVQVQKEIPLKKGDEVFYIRNSNSHCELPESLSQEYNKLKCSSYRQFSVFKLQRTK